MSQCLVVNRKVLGSLPLWQRLCGPDGTISTAIALSSDEVEELLGLVEQQGIFMEREGTDGVERKPEWQQVIFYALIVQGNRFFVYHRGGGTAYKKVRLQGKLSAGVGGHIEPFDTNLIDSLYRELDEEVMFTRNKKAIPFRGDIRIIGLIKDDKDDVGRVHVGFVCLVELKDSDIEIALGDEENVRGWMVTLTEYHDLVSSQQYVPENWTTLLVEHIATPLLKSC